MCDPSLCCAKSRKISLDDKVRGADDRNIIPHFFLHCAPPSTGGDAVYPQCSEVILGGPKATADFLRGQIYRWYYVRVAPG